MAEYASLISLSFGRMFSRGADYLASNYRVLLPAAVAAVLLILFLVRLINPPKN